MKTPKLASLFFLFLIPLCLVGCCRSADDLWDDTRTAGRHMSRGFRSLGGKHGDSRQIRCREDFYRYQTDYCIEDFQAMEFEPLPDQNYAKEIAMNESTSKGNRAQQPLQEPGLPSSNIPGIDGFRDPRQDSALKEIFKTIQFPYNSSLVKGKENMDKLRTIAEFMKKQPNIYLFVEGHCDERGAEAYNLALGSRRSNSVRSILIKEGVGPERIFTVSYGKEMPVNFGHNEEAWAKNRRAEFKIYRG